MARLVLASSSPRRVELLRLLVSDYVAAASSVEDTGSDLSPDFPIPTLPVPESFQVSAGSHPTLWAWRKAVDIASRSPHANGDVVVLGADTVVLGEGALLGKPSDSEHAFRMLSSLRGRMHYVATGYAVVVRDENEGIRTVRTGATVSQVWMRDYSDEELKGYVATGEPLDKAGAYALQGLGGSLVRGVEGCHRNVVGLPLCAVREALLAAGVAVLPYPAGGYCPHCP
jgi:septum formation protein